MALVDYLSSCNSECDPKLWEVLISKGDDLTREDIFIAMFKEFQQLTLKRITDLEKKEKAEISTVQILERSPTQADASLLTQFTALTVSSASEESFEAPKKEVQTRSVMQ